MVLPSIIEEDREPCDDVHPSDDLSSRYRFVLVPDNGPSSLSTPTPATTRTKPKYTSNAMTLNVKRSTHLASTPRRKARQYCADDDDDARSVVSTISSVPGLAVQAVAAKAKLMSANAKERAARRERERVQKIEARIQDLRSSNARKLEELAKIKALNDARNKDLNKRVDETVAARDDKEENKILVSEMTAEIESIKNTLAQLSLSKKQEARAEKPPATNDDEREGAPGDVYGTLESWLVCFMGDADSICSSSSSVSSWDYPDEYSHETKRSFASHFTRKSARRSTASREY